MTKAILNMCNCWDTGDLKTSFFCWFLIYLSERSFQDNCCIFTINSVSPCFEIYFGFTESCNFLQGVTFFCVMTRLNSLFFLCNRIQAILNVLYLEYIEPFSRKMTYKITFHFEYWIKLHLVYLIRFQCQGLLMNYICDTWEFDVKINWSYTK